MAAGLWAKNVYFRSAIFQLWGDLADVGVNFFDERAPGEAIEAHTSPSHERRQRET